MIVRITEDRGVTFRDVDESELIKRVDVFENDDQRLEATEYCFAGCQGQAHVTGAPQGDGSFCEQHVHRSVAMVLKRWPIEAGAAAASLV